MSRVAKLYMKDSGEIIKVNITNDKPHIDDVIQEKWQGILNIITKLISVRASLVNRLDEEHIEIFMKSQNENNPYSVGLCDPVGQGAYCELVMGSMKALVVENAKKDKVWEDSLYAEYNWLSYFGMPITWPDGEMFGTLCVIDSKENNFDETFQSLFAEFKGSMEKDLEILMQKHELALQAEIDGLTNVLNRRKIDEVLEMEFLRAKRYQHKLSIVMMDINKFKAINDHHGHLIGDKVLKVFARVFKERVRITDYFGRYGGDEFVLICPETDVTGVAIIIQDIEKQLAFEMASILDNFSFSYGISTYTTENNCLELLGKADTELYEMKTSLA